MKTVRSAFIIAILLSLVLPSRSANLLNPEMVCTAVPGLFPGGDTVVWQYTFPVHVRYELTDTASLYFLDIRDGFIRSVVFNGCRENLEVRSTYNHLWIKPFCVVNNWDSLGQFTPDTNDSLDFLGRSNQAFIVPVAGSQRLGLLNLSSTRLFVEWDTLSRKTVATMDFDMTVTAHDDSVIIGGSDSIVITIELVNFIATDRMGRTWTSVTTAAAVPIGRSDKKVPNPFSVSAMPVFTGKNSATGSNFVIQNGYHSPVVRRRLFRLDGSILEAPQ